MTFTIIEADREPEPEKKLTPSEMRDQAFSEWYEVWLKCKHTSHDECCVNCYPKPKWVY